MTTYALLMFNKDEASGVVRNAARLRAVVDEIVVVDSSSPEGYEALLEQLAPFGATVRRALPLGHVDPLRPFGVSLVRSDFVLILDADEEPSDRLVARLRQLDEHAAYVVPRYEVALKGFTYHLRLFRPNAVHYTGRSFDFPEVRGSTGRLGRDTCILHHAPLETYFEDKARARRYFTVESYERPFTFAYMAEALTLRLRRGAIRLPVRPRDPDAPLSAAAVRLVVETEFLRDLLQGRGLGVARFNRRYSLAKASYFRHLAPAEQSRILDVARDIRESGGLFPYLGLGDPSYVQRLTTGFTWDRPGLQVYEELLRYRRSQGRPAERLGFADGSDRAGVETPATPPDAKLSIVIPTHDRPERLRALLASIRDAASPVVESIIIVDDSSTRSRPEDEFPGLPITHLASDRRMFISRAKNLGWRAARSEFVFFIDDDNIVSRDTLERPLAVAARRSSIGAVVPAVLYHRRPDLVWVYATPLAPGRWGHTLVGRNRPRDPRLEGRLLATDALPNASLVRRAALEAIGGFRESLEVNSSADAALRLQAAGWEVLADSGTFIQHDVEPPGRGGYWAQHGAADPERVFHEVHDWFVLMQSLHGSERLFPLRASWHALGFLLPNGMTYLVRGGPRGRRAFGQLVRGYLDGLRATTRRVAPGT